MSERIPLRPNPTGADAQDPERVALAKDRWSGQDMAYVSLNRTVEEHIRMLAGRQWDQWSEILGRFVDPLRYMSDDEKRWRQRPVMDYLGYWFMVTLSKVTENQPIVGFLPSNLDEHSAMLAEVMDPIYKTLWDRCEMSDRFMSAAAWTLAGGESYLMTRPDYTEGEEQELIGPAVLSLDRGEGQDPIERTVDAVPFDADGEPLAKLQPEPDESGQYGYDVTGEPHTQKKGTIKVEVGSTLEVRAQWGSNIPWNEKRWIMHRWFLSPDEVMSRWSVKVDPDVFPDSGDASPGSLERLFFGSGYFGAARQEQGAQSANNAAQVGEGFVCGYTMWEKPSEGFPEGRLLVVAGEQCLFDGPRPANFECAGPIRKVGFMPLPGRPVDSTPLEKMVPLQKRLNRIEAQIAEHTNLCTNPILFLHADAGVDADEFSARPGLTITHDMQGPGQPGFWLAPPALSADVWKHKADVRDHLFTIGSINGNDSASPGAAPSGELIQQLRYNADRPLSPLTRSLEHAAAGVAEDMMAILPTIWTDEEVIHYAGEDNIVHTLTVLPEMWDGQCCARPVMESAAPETREKRQMRVSELYQMGAFGNLMDPEQQPKAIAKFLELSRFPDMTRAARPGGVHRNMAERNLGRLLRGEPSEGIPILPVYDLDVHLDITSDYMAGPDFLAQEKPIQEEITLHWQELQAAQQAQVAMATEQESGLQATQQIINAQMGEEAGRIAGVIPPGAQPGAAPAPGAGPNGSVPDQSGHAA